MPEKIFAEFYAGSLFNGFVGLTDVASCGADGHGRFGEDHAAGEYFEVQTVCKRRFDLRNHRAESITPAAIGVVTVYKCWCQSLKAQI